MTNWNYVEDGDSGGPANDPNIRQYIKSLEKRIEAAESREKQAQAEAEQAKLNSAFQSLGVPASVAGLYTGPKDAESAAQWVNDMRSVFGGNAPQTNAPASQNAQFDANAYQRMSEAGANSVPTSGIDDAQRAVDNADSLEDLFAAFKGLNAS